MVWIESQCAAVPADPNDDLLVEWKKVQTPFLPLPPKEMDLTGWRDPFAFSLNTFCTLSNSTSIGNGTGNSTNSTGAMADGESSRNKTEEEDRAMKTAPLDTDPSTSSSSTSPEFRILMGSGIKGKGGTALIYRSRDLMQGWELEGTLCEGTIEDSGVVWECPLLVPLLPVPPQQRSRHQHIPPAWLHQPGKISNRTMSPSLSPSPWNFHKEEKTGAAILGGTGSLGGRLGRLGVFTPPSTSSPAPSGSEQMLESPFQKDASAGSSIEGSPLKRPTGAATAATALPIMIPNAITTAVKDLLDLSKQEGKEQKQNLNRAETEVETENEFEFISSGGISPGEGSDGGGISPGSLKTTEKGGELPCLDRQKSVEMWPSSAEAVSPTAIKEPKQSLVNSQLESYHSIAGGTGASTDFPVHELAAKLERAVTLENWNMQGVGSVGNGSIGGGNNDNGGSSSSGNGWSAGDSRQSTRSASRLSAVLDEVPEVKESVAPIGPAFGSRLGNYNNEGDEDDDEVEEAVVSLPPLPAAAATTTTAEAAAVPVTITSAPASRSPSSSRLMPPSIASSSYSGVSSADDISEDRFAMAFSKVPALQVKEKSAASLGLVEKTAIDNAAGVAAAAVVEKKAGISYPIPAAGNASSLGQPSLSTYGTDMTPMHPQSTQQPHSLSTLPQQQQQQHGGNTGNTSTEQRQWHFFTISPDAPTNPVLYWTGFMSHDLFSNGTKGEENQQQEEDAGPAVAIEGIDSTSNKSQKNEINKPLLPPPQFEIDDAKGPYRLDLGDILYAPNVCQDGQGRWILWGWLQERRKMGTYSYAGCLSLPRVLHATDEGRLVQAPAPEVVALRKGREFHAHQVALYPESMLPIQRVSGDRLDIECTIERGSALAAGLLFRSHEAEAEGSTAIVYDWDRNHLEAIFNVPPNWQPSALPQQSYPNSATAAAAAAAKGDDEFSFNEQDLIGLDDALQFDPAAYLCTPRYSMSRTPSMNVFSPDAATMASSPHAPLVGAAGVFSDTSPSPPVSTSSPVDSISNSIFSTGMNSEIGGLVQQHHGAIQKQGSSLQHALLRSSSYASLAGAANAAAGGGGIEREIRGSLAKSSSLLGSSMPRVGSFIQRQTSYLPTGSPRSQAIIDASEAAEMDAELSTLLEDLAAPMRGNAGEEGAAPPQMPEPRRVGGPLLMRPADKLHLRIFVDHSCVEVFTGTGEVLSTRIYRGQQPQSSSFFDGTGEVDAGIEFVAFGGAAVIEKVSAYEVGSAWKDHGAETAPSSRWETPTAAQAVGQSQKAVDAAGGGTPGSSTAGGHVGKSAAERADDFFDEMLMGF
jgi:sucrose-6-phosphate hydrolase SacC (GH32 family)